ncbi:MAG: dTDP-4-dehydrorhamnose reductase [Deltaproteobacteria bacterium]|nr:dTDP-4-dehydrorhamnose reductase [Deltaproteobacteria bacterium]
MGAPIKLVLIGANGMLGQTVQEALPVGYELVAGNYPQVDLLQPSLVAKILQESSPDIIVNCAAHTAVDACEKEQELALHINGEGPGLLAALAKKLAAVLVHVSTDYVFDGASSIPYREEDDTGPQSAYGRSKLAGEQAILERGLERFFIVRTSWLYGPHGKNFVETILRLAGEKEEIRIVADQIGSPTLTDDLAGGLFRLLKTELFGVYHFSNEGKCSWHEFACAIVEGARQRGAKLKVERIVPIRTEDYPLPAPRPAFSLMDKGKYRAATGCDVPHWREALGRYLDRRLGKIGA